jgi:hypothetical protein
MSGRPDLESFEPGVVYLHDETGRFVEFVGKAAIPELDGEDVAVFRCVSHERALLVATQHSYSCGDRFTPARQVLSEATSRDD